ncbi:MAG: DNA-processing protein DprA [Bacteroidetes bacterium]|nr:DNA-processing protein DprA [Bacteroidota bacterium]
MQHALFYQIALGLVPGVGDVLMKTLVAHCGSAEEVFREKRQMLASIPGVNMNTATAIKSFRDWERAEFECAWVQQNGIRALFFTESEYPFRLKHCNDSPGLLFVKGNMDLNARRMIGVVGTRRASRQGKARTTLFTTELAGYGCSIISGLAYGIDAQAHQAAVDAGIPTGAVVAHGLDVLYPPSHHQLARNMLDGGGAIISDQLQGMKLSPEHFPRRNRIIAGLCDALLLVESMADGGAMITADIAASYNRDVFAVPGRPDDHASAGCNLLIQQNKAALVCSADDIAELMGWNRQVSTAGRQIPLFRDLSEEQQTIIGVLQQGAKTVDELFDETGFSGSKLAHLLLNMELDGLITQLPGMSYQLRT